MFPLFNITYMSPCTEKDMFSLFDITYMSPHTEKDC